MPRDFAELLTPEKAMIFRITHRANLPWILEHGLHCRVSDVADPNFVPIGNPELIEKRAHREVEAPPGGSLADYVPFYFTPCSPMLLNIITGMGVPMKKREDIIVLVSSMDALEEHGVDYVLTDRHAYLRTAKFFEDRSRLGEAVDFALLRSRDFSRDPEHPEKFDRYQAEALAYRHVPPEALVGVACYTSAIVTEIEPLCAVRNVGAEVAARPEWYFS